METTDISISQMVVAFSNQNSDILIRDQINRTFYIKIITAIIEVTII